jgi:hypothetical protein
MVGVKKTLPLRKMAGRHEKTNEFRQATGDKNHFKLVKKVYFSRNVFFGP